MLFFFYINFLAFSVFVHLSEPEKFFYCFFFLYFHLVNFESSFFLLFSQSLLSFIALVTCVVFFFFKQQ